MKRIVCLAIVILALSGCGPRATERGFQAMVDSYTGQHIDTLVAQWGPPQYSYIYEDGRREYSFVKSRQVTSMSPAFGGFYGSRWGWAGWSRFPMYQEHVRYYRCEARVSADRSGRITNISYRGNGCRALEVNRSVAPSSGADCGS